MIITTSVSELRANISHFIERVLKGGIVLIRDEKRGVTVAQIVQASSFDKETYANALQRAAGVFTVENHPEWSALHDVVSWVASNRKKDERTF